MGSAQSELLTQLEFGEELTKNASNVQKIWTSVFPARLRKTENVSVFIKHFDDDPTLIDDRRKFFDNGIKNLKRLRHPNVLKFFASANFPNETYLVVERIRPMDFCLNVDEPVEFESEEILSGIQDICDAVKFLHDKVNISHNNVCPSAVFVSDPDSVWKLGSFEFSMPSDDSAHWCQSEFVKSVKNIEFVPPEDQKVMADEKSPSHARDVYGLGKLIEYLLPFLEGKIDEEQKCEISNCIDDFCNSNANNRPPLTDVDYPTIFRNALNDVVSTLRNIPLIKEEELNVIFSSILPKLRSIPQVVVARRLTKTLLSRYVFIERSAFDNFLNFFLTPKTGENEDGILNMSLFKKFVIPELSRIFRVHEKSVRLNLLSVFERYIDAFDRQQVQTCILPELLLGMKDVDESIVTSSMTCLARIVPILGPSDVTGLVHAKYFSDGHRRADFDVTLKDDIDLSKLTSVKSTLVAESPKHLPPSAEKHSKKSPKLRKKSIEKPKKVIETDHVCSTFVEEPKKPDFDRSPDRTVNESSFQSASSEWVDWEADEDKDVDDYSTPLDVSSTPNVFVVEPPERLSITREIPTPIFVQGQKSMGSEFDVLAIEVRQEDDEIDKLFNDMAPTVRKPLVSSVKLPSKFDVTLTEDEPNASGWKDDEEW